MAKKKISADPNSIFQTAELFSKTVGLLDQAISHGEFLVVPLIVNSAFTVELYLKCLITIENGGYGREHNLYNLFNLLSNDSKKFITAKYNELTSADPIVMAMKQHFNGVIKFDIVSVLKDIADAFIAYRYHFENSQKDGFANSWNIRTAVKKRILDLKPNIGDVGNGGI